MAPGISTCLTGTNAYQFRFTSRNTVAFTKANIATIVESTRTITDGLWHHIVAVKNGTAVALYIDGVNVTGTVTNQTLTNATSSTLRLGTDSTLYLNGSLDEVAIYNTALSPQRIAAHFTAGRPTP